MSERNAHVCDIPIVISIAETPTDYSPARREVFALLTKRQVLELRYGCQVVTQPPPLLGLICLQQRAS